MPRSLLLTIGTGDVAALEASLFTPLILSIRQGEWARLVLLPSLATGPNAQEIRRRLDARDITIAPLPRRGAENDADNVIERTARARLTDRGPTSAGRKAAIDQLARVGDPIGRALLALDSGHELLRAGTRNNSILVHGHDSVGAIDQEAWRPAFGALEDVPRKDAALRGKGDDFARDLAAARCPGNGGRP